MKILKGVVIYDSSFGNTERIARALALGLEDKGAKIDCFKIDQVDVEKLVEYDFIAIGGPTHIISASKPMKEFLGRLKTVDLRGLKGFSFDTRNESRMNSRKWLMLENSASRVIESALRGMKVDIIKPRRSAIVEGREGPLYEGMEETFKQMGVEIAETLQ
jgi:flavodoxin